MSMSAAKGPGFLIPESAISWKGVRASGPGGQNVNKVASKVELRVDPRQIEGLNDGARARLMTMAAARLDADGLILITSQLTRDQGRNLEDAMAKAREIVARALVVPKTRRPTRPSRAAKARRVDAKKLDAKRKSNRGRTSFDE